MQCDEIVEQLLAPDQDHDLELQQHIETCIACAGVARGLRRVDTIVSRSVLVEPPVEVQRRLALLVDQAAQPQAVPWWRRPINFDWLVLRPNVIAAQGLAAVMLALASWQVFGWLSLFRPVIGDVGYAMQLVAASPAAGYLGGLQIDLQSLTIWSLIGIGGWLISENGLLGKQASALAARLRLS